MKPFKDTVLCCVYNIFNHEAHNKQVIIVLYSVFEFQSFLAPKVQDAAVIVGT